MLSEVRRQPNGVEAPHVYMQRLRPVETFPPRLGGALGTVPVRDRERFATMYVQSLWFRARNDSPGSSLLTLQWCPSTPLGSASLRSG